MLLGVVSITLIVINWKNSTWAFSKDFLTWPPKDLAANFDVEPFCSNFVQKDLTKTLSDSILDNPCGSAPGKYALTRGYQQCSLYSTSNSKFGWHILLSVNALFSSILSISSLHSNEKNNFSMLYKFL